jgi:hypothetical protein
MARRFDPDNPQGELPPELAELLPTPDELHEIVKKAFGPQHAVLDESGEPRPAALMEWANWFEHNYHQRVIVRTNIERERPGAGPELYTVSTVFLGVNHQYLPNAKPLWFETMVFGPPYLKFYEYLNKTDTVRDDLWRRQTTTKTQAIETHAEGLAWLKNYLAQLDPSHEPTQS